MTSTTRTARKPRAITATIQGNDQQGYVAYWGRTASAGVYGSREDALALLQDQARQAGRELRLLTAPEYSAYRGA